MKVLVTGATGFVGGWLMRELVGAGHDVTPAPGSAELDIANMAGVRSLVADVRPDVIAHLAAVTSGHEASRDPGRAVRTIVGGTVAVTEAARLAGVPPALLVVSSAEVYATPAQDDPPLTEGSPLAPRSEYGMLKLAAEAVAIAAAQRHDLPMVVVRPFNHVGPGQPPRSAVAAFAEQIAAVRDGSEHELAVGTIDVERDIGDVRDYVVAYRLLMEALAAGELGRPPGIFNVSTGRAVSLRWVIGELCRLASVSPDLVVVPALVRRDDPPRIVGDASLLGLTIDWQPSTELSATLADVLAQHVA